LLLSNLAESLSFTADNKGFGAAIAIVLLIAVIPVMIYNLRQFGEQEAF